MASPASGIKAERLCEQKRKGYTNEKTVWEKDKREVSIMNV
jgi:hypothetical protein